MTPALAPSIYDELSDEELRERREDLEEALRQIKLREQARKPAKGT